MKPMIYVFLAGPGDTLPKIVTTATVQGSRVICDHEGYQNWLQAAATEVVLDRGVPSTEEDHHEVVEAICALSQGTRVFASATPLI